MLARRHWQDPVEEADMRVLPPRVPAPMALSRGVFIPTGSAASMNRQGRGAGGPRLSSSIPPPPSTEGRPRGA